MSPKDKPLAWIHGEVRSPPFSTAARVQAGFLLRQLQQGVNLSLPISRPLPSIAAGVHELRIQDEADTWRIIYAVRPIAIVILHVFSKKTQTTPKSVITVCRERLKRFDREVKDQK